MIVTLAEILKIASEKGNAVGAFNCTGLECVKAIIGAAEETKKPVIIQYAELHKTYVDMETMVRIMLYEAQKATVPVCVHFDHGESVESCCKAIDLGFTSVMFDGSALPYEENIEKSAQVVSYAKEKGASVEAELGHIFASKIGAGERGVEFTGSAESAYTDPALAADFVKQTNVDALAVAFGTTHGVYLTKPVLDLNRIKLIQEKVDIPLVMHGGSGLSVEDYQTAIRNGIRKVNYYTYMAMTGGEAVKNMIKEADNEIVFFHDIANVAIQAMKEKVREEMEVFAL